MTLYSSLVTLLIIWVRVSPAATTNMEAMVMTVLLPNVAMAALLSQASEEHQGHHGPPAR